MEVVSCLISTWKNESISKVGVSMLERDGCLEWESFPVALETSIFIFHFEL
jgi:hypothetical protein